MTSDSLEQALRACSSGIYAAEASVGMLIAHATWLDRDDFRQFIHADPEAGMAAIDWPAVTAALTAGKMPSSNGEQKMLRMAASLAGQTPVILGDTITGLDDRNIQILVSAVLHASGQRQFPPAS
jgi:ABC-type cobalamin/Fe3+-siderophores transport system ATPase subunit